MKKTRVDDAPLLPYLDEREQRINADHAWCAADANVRRKHGGKIAAVYKRKVLGVGKTYAAALAAAQRRRRCPPKHEIAMVVVPRLLPALAASEK
jgi:hypothetical protein